MMFVFFCTDLTQFSQLYPGIWPGPNQAAKLLSGSTLILKQVQDARSDTEKAKDQEIQDERKEAGSEVRNEYRVGQHEVARKQPKMSIIVNL